MAPRFRIRDIALSERLVRFRTPFRFGAVTVHEAPQLFVHVEIEVEGHGVGRGAAAELMVPKWFNKDPSLTADDTIGQLRQSMSIARGLYLGSKGAETAFARHAVCLPAQLSTCAAKDIPALAACFGPAEIDKAVLDALFRALGLDVFSGLRTNAAGLDNRLTPDLDNAAIERFLASRKPASRIAVRHTVGLLDAVDELGKLVGSDGCGYFKLKLSGDPAKDIERLSRIAAEFADLGVDYRATLDANEQYADMAALRELVQSLEANARLRPLAERLLYIEQPLPRERTFDVPLGDLAREFAFIIDEADDRYDAFPRARALGYRGVSSKSCKGLYKSLLNGARAAQAAGEEAFLTAEDLTCQAGLAVQQDTALIAFLGIEHAERNGHHYVDGFADTPAEEARAFLAAHHDLYEESDGKVRLKIRDGALSIASLSSSAGFASGVAPDQVGSRANINQVIKEYVQ